MKKIVLFLCIVALCYGNPMVKDDTRVEDVETKMIDKLDELKKTHSIRVYGDIVTLDKIDESETEGRGTQSDDPLLSSVDNFFNSRRIHIKLPNDGSAADFIGRAIGKKEFDIQLRGLTHGASEARTKLKKIILPVLLALKLKALIILPIVITIIGLIGIKGLGAGMAALLLSGAVALKALLTPPPPYPAARVSYGIVKPEVHHDHWHRSQEEINQPYRAWAPEYNVDSYPYQDLP